MSSRLNARGLPQVAVGRVELDHATLNPVESKSFKLYLNSFNQTKFTSPKRFSTRWSVIYAFVPGQRDRCPVSPE